MEKSEEGMVSVHFTEGEPLQFGAIACVPPAQPSVDIAPILAQLKLEDAVQVRGHLLSTPPFGNVKPGVFVAGDAATPLSQVVQAQATGQLAGFGADEELAREDMQLLLSGCQ
jgi:hypothetical protein